MKSVTVVPGGSDMPAEMEKVAEKLRSQGRKPYIVPGGASNTVGALGYVSCGEEMFRQMFDMGLAVDHLVVPSGSGGTHSGILASVLGNNMRLPVTGIGVGRAKDAQRALVHGLTEQTLAYIRRWFVAVRDEDVAVFDDYVGPGYSLPTPAMIEAVLMLARTESILLDPVYSGKAMSGLIESGPQGLFPQGRQCAFPAHRRLARFVRLSRHVP